MEDSGITAQTLGRLTEVLYINMFGEGQRNNKIISIGDFNEKSTYSKICLRIAETEASMYNYKIKLGCSFFSYIKFLAHKKVLFKKHRYLWDRKNEGRPAEEWLTDISRANKEEDYIWFLVWRYINDEDELD